ncbi:hypothetical protein BCY84_10334 [Trypanosoma cruzi cruzi]|nr:hypothetical protein BCY84_10331 [Trypanosoma cruzi cruzi]PBJ76073.1 hypothetical protein BCY84_10334 [Trypanosoma cruzi cruzi]
MGFFPFLLFPPFNCFCCTLPVRGAVCSAQLLHSHTHRHAHDDDPVRLACCTHEEGRDERRAEGAVTCGRATRACGAEHTFLSSCFVFLRSGRADTRSTTPTQPHPAAVFLRFFLLLCAFLAPAVPSAFLSPPMIFFFFCCAHSPDGVTRLPSCLRASLSPHTHE